MSTILTYGELEKIMLSPELPKGQFIRLDSRTEAKATVKSRKTLESFEKVFGCQKVYKINSRQVQLKVDYENAVNGRREKEGLEGDFKSQGTYGTVENNTIVRKNEDQWYLRVFHVKNPLDKVKWVRDNGEELTPDLVKRLENEFLPLPKEGKGKQELENEVKPLNFKSDSILAIRMNGVEYIMARV